MVTSGISSRVAEDGYAVIRNLIRPGQVEILREKVSSVCSAMAPGARKPELKDEAFRHLAFAEELLSIVRELTGPDVRPVRMLLFDKTADANWSVPWHQDLSIAVMNKAELDGYSGWSLKHGVTHVQPPATILELMLTCRIHLDDADESNGALMVIPGSHLRGRIRESAIDAIVSSEATVVCGVGAGDVMVMRPLILHASRKARSPEHRRVIHIEYAAMDLPAPLAWAGI